MSREDEFRRRVWKANLRLREEGLVPGTTGNASALDPDSDLVYIKPSGKDYAELEPAHIVAVRLTDGEPVSGDLKPSVDLPHHLYLYRHLPGTEGVVHTHSGYATAFAATGRSVPCVLTGMADVFGGEIPCLPYAGNAGEDIGRTIVAHRGRGPGVILRNHGVFTFDHSVEAAVKAAVMLEDSAKSVWLAYALGEPIPLDPAQIEQWWDRYHTTYGQKE
jgi:L-ribulose-5-phosphate 4-epimerase